jgi:MYXO-CTERM domain-containing protein
MLATDARAATVPEHDPLQIVIIADEVNPNGLSDAELTQPDDVNNAIVASGSGLSVAAVTFSLSNCVDEAVQALENEDIDVLVYFAHVAATDCSGLGAQPRLDAAVEAHLQGGGGVVVFHHGLYTAPGKEEILRLLGGTANSIFWDTTTGQDVINVAPDHFVAMNELEYTQTRAFADAGFGIPMMEYGVFNNTPDERYPGVQFITEPGESREILFASDYSGAQILGYDLHRPDWGGHVVFYQPGEFQPNALDDVDGNNFQIFANAIWWAATQHEDPVDPTGGGSSESGDDSTGGSASNTGNVSASGDEAGNTSATTAGSDTDTEGPAAANGDEGCGCRSAGGSGLAPLVVVVGFALRRRRRGV